MLQFEKLYAIDSLSGSVLVYAGIAVIETNQFDNAEKYLRKTASRGSFIRMRLNGIYRNIR